MNTKRRFSIYLREHGVLVAVIFIGIIIFALRFTFAVWQSERPDGLENDVGKAIILRGIITDEPDRREDSTMLTVDVYEVGEAKNSSKIQTRLLVTVDRYSNWQYGDRISISGKLKKPENFSSDTGIDFDYVSYLAKDDIRYEMVYPKISLINQGNGNFIRGKLLLIKNAFMRRIESAIPEPESSLMGGLLLGAKHSLGKKLLEDFRRAGVIHIVVLSGYNITIIAEFIMLVLGFLPSFFSFTFGIIGIVLFVGMTGAGASTIRAATMALLAIIARAFGRTYSASRALFIVAFGMLILNPRLLFSDPSFQLSFLATFGLIYVSPIVEKNLPLARFLPEKFHIRELVIATLTTQIFLLPFLLYQTGLLSLVALPVNLLILGFIPFTMLMGFITGVVSFFSVTLALPFAFLAHIFLAYIIFIAQFFSNLPFAVFTTSVFPLWLMVVIYTFYSYILYKFYKK